MRAFHPAPGSNPTPDRSPSPNSPDCIHPDRLRSYINEALPPAEEATVEAHIETCERCSRAIKRLTDPHLQDLPEIPEFEIDAVLAQGGMGTIYRAYDLVLHRDVAIKMLKPSLKDDAELRDRFVTEARSAGRLQHPGILPIYDYRQLEDGRPYLVMKMVNGKTLARLLSDRVADNRTDDQFLDYFVQMCKAVAYAHLQGVIHRDLKPSNVMVGEHGEVQVMDWGLAKERDSVSLRAAATAANQPTQDDDSTPSPSLGLTKHGLGTVQYMPPEQAIGSPDLDARADVFALGAILCEILTGLPPYAGDGTQTSAFGRVLTAAEVADLKPAYARLATSGADPKLITLATACLQKDRDQRPRSANEVAQRVGACRMLEKENVHSATLKEVEERRKKEAEARAQAELRAREDREARAAAEARSVREQRARARAERRAVRAAAIASAAIAMLLIVVLCVWLGWKHLLK